MSETHPLMSIMASCDEKQEMRAVQTIHSVSIAADEPAHKARGGSRRGNNNNSEAQDQVVLDDQHVEDQGDAGESRGDAPSSPAGNDDVEHNFRTEEEEDAPDQDVAVDEAGEAYPEDTTRTADDEQQSRRAPAKKKSSPARNGAVVKRLSTPERIRQRTQVLYGEVHELMDRHEERVERKRELQRLERPGAAYSASQRSGSRGGNGRKTKAPPAPVLPNLQQTFEDCCRARLQEMRGVKAEFPPIERPPGFSETDPGAFSLRFEGALYENRGKR